MTRKLHHSAKLYPQDIRDIRAARLAGATYPAIARRYGIAVSQAHKIVARKVWKHVE